MKRAILTGILTAGLALAGCNTPQERTTAQKGTWSVDLDSTAPSPVRTIDGTLSKAPIIVNSNPSYLTFDVKDKLTGQTKKIEIPYRTESAYESLVVKQILRETGKDSFVRFGCKKTNETSRIPLQDLKSYSTTRN